MISVKSREAQALITAEKGSGKIVPPKKEVRASLLPSQPVTRFHLKTYLPIAVMVIAGPLGNIFLGKGMKHMGELPVWPLPALVHTGLKICASGSIWLGIASLIVFFVAYMLALSLADFSFVQPAASLAYGVVAVLGYFMLGERVSPLRGVGIAVICFGVFIVGRTNPRTPERI
jgi:hypothetical protein